MAQINVSIPISKDCYAHKNHPRVAHDESVMYCGVRDISFTWHQYRLLLYADISAIPAGSTIVSCAFVFTVNGTFGSTGSYTVRIEKVEAPRSWVEADASWEQRNTLVDWDTPGIDVESPPAPVDNPFITSNGLKSLGPLKAIAQDALDNEGGDFAIRLKRTIEVDLERAFSIFDMLNAIETNRPRLSIVYNAPVIDSGVRGPCFRRVLLTGSFTPLSPTPSTGNFTIFLTGGGAEAVTVLSDDGVTEIMLGIGKTLFLKRVDLALIQVKGTGGGEVVVIAGTIEK